MTTQTQDDRDQVVYPDSDGQPMSDNTLQFRWIVTLQGNLDIIFRRDPNVFVAGDLLWYAVEGQAAVRTAPDVLVVFGRPKGYRGSYRQWQEGGIAPQAVFEVLSPGNRRDEMDRKFQFYDQYGVEEYYLYDPDTNDLQGWRRQQGRLLPIHPMHGWVSPHLQVRFDLSGDELVIFRPDGTRFLTFLQLEQLRQEAQAEAEQARRQAEQALRQAEQALRQAEQALRQAEQAQRQTELERKGKERLAAQLRALGIEPEA